MLAVLVLELFHGAVNVDFSDDPYLLCGNLSDSNRHLNNWSIILQGNNLEIVHIHGRDNTLADARSSS